MARQRHGRSAIGIRKLGMGLLGLVGVVIAQEQSTTSAQSPLDIINSKDLTKEKTCKIVYHQSAILDDKLYIVGGVVVYADEALRKTPVPNTVLRVLDLTKPLDLTNNATIPYETSLLDSKVPGIAIGALWPNTVNKTLTLLPGTGSYGVSVSGNITDPTIQGYNAPKLDETWVYDVTKKSWSMVKAQFPTIGGAFGFGMAPLWVEKLKRGYLLGGAHGWWDTAESVTDVMPGNLVTFEQESGKWSNDTTHDSLTRKFGAGMVYIESIGKSGALVVVGGLEEKYAKPTGGLSAVDVYDIATATWFRQRTSGTIPSTRDSFCLLATSAPDKSSYSIHLYAGGNKPFGKAPELIGTTYILSLPTFTWIKGNEEQHSKNPRASGENDEMTCHLVNSRQMMVIGGRSKYPINDGRCGASAGQINLLDLSTLSWQSEYQPLNQPYKVPSVVWSVIGGNSEGGAPSRAPENGWIDDKLEAMFKVDPKDQDFDLSPSSSTSDSKKSDSSSKITHGGAEAEDSDYYDPKKTPVGAIVGGVIGGVVGLGLICVGIWFCLRKRRIRLEDEAYAAAAASHRASELGGMPMQMRFGVGAEGAGYGRAASMSANGSSINVGSNPEVAPEVVPKPYGNYYGPEGRAEVIGSEGGVYETRGRGDNEIPVSELQGTLGDRYEMGTHGTNWRGDYGEPSFGAGVQQGGGGWTGR